MSNEKNNNKKYDISRSDYTIKKRGRQLVDGGRIYETDLSTIKRGSEIVDGKLITRTEGGFVMVSNIEDTKQVDKIISTKESKTFTLELLNNNEIKSPEIDNEQVTKKYVELEENFIRLSDYAYFGSLNLKLMVDINDIITNFPYDANNKQDVINYVNTLNGFQKRLLNINGEFLYKTNFIIPVETDGGIVEINKNFTWPRIDELIIDVESLNFEMYLNSLIDATNLIDERYTDNLYRMLTHDTIKNFDHTEGDIDEMLLGNNKVSNVLRIYGGMYDKIKLYIDNIKHSNNITYNRIDNTPNKYITNQLNIRGWEEHNLINDYNFVNIDNDYNFDDIEEYLNVNFNMTTYDFINEINRTLLVNSKYLMASKGTINIIPKILSILGIKEDWYEIDEYYLEVDESEFITDMGELENIKEKNYTYLNIDSSVADGIESYDNLSDDELTKGINIKIIEGVGEPYASENTLNGYYHNSTGNGYGYVRDFIQLFRKYGDDEENGFEINKDSFKKIKNKTFKEDDNQKINLKNVYITFKNSINENEFNFINGIVTQLLKQLIPETTILKIIRNTTAIIPEYLESYCEQNVEGEYTGDLIVSFVNANPNSSNWQDITTISNKIIPLIKEWLNISDQTPDITVEYKDGTGGFMSIYNFKVSGMGCNNNIKPEWRITNF